ARGDGEVVGDVLVRPVAAGQADDLDAVAVRRVGLLAERPVQPLRLLLRQADADHPRSSLSARVALSSFIVRIGQPVRASVGVAGAAFTPDGRRAVSGGRDRTLRVWDLGSGEEVRRLDGPEDTVSCLALSPDGGLVLSGGHTGVRLWDLSR